MNLGAFCGCCKSSVGLSKMQETRFKSKTTISNGPALKQHAFVEAHIENYWMMRETQETIFYLEF